MLSYSNQSMEIAQYLSSISCPFKQSRVSYLLDDIVDFLNAIKILWRYKIDIPPIRIRDNSFPNAEANNMVIFINTGIIDHCLGIEPPHIDAIISATHHTYEYNYNLVSKTAFCWILAHEFFHIARKHDEGSKIYGRDILTMIAQENDADMCALSFIYRWYQFEFSYFFTSDSILRQHVFYAIFLTLRTLPEPEEAGLHPPNAERLWNLLMKLISLRSNPNDAADQNCESDEAKALAPPLRKCLIQCEIEFQKTFSYQDTKINLLDYLKKIIDEEKYKPAIDRWNEIKDHSI